MKHETGRNCGSRGAVLAISLMLMLIMTLLAASAMRTATLELMVAGNIEGRESAFEAAQVGLDVAQSMLNSGSLALVAADDWIHENAVSGDVDEAGTTYTASLRYLYSGDPPPGAGIGGRRAAFFEIEAAGHNPVRNARSIQTRGLWVAEDRSGPIHLSYWFENPAR